MKEIISIENVPEKEFIITRTGTSMSASLKMANKMDREPLPGPAVRFTRVNGHKTNAMERAVTYGPTVMNTKANGKIIWPKGMVCFAKRRTGIPIRGIFIKENKTAKEYLSTKTGIATKERSNKGEKTEHSSKPIRTGRSFGKAFIVSAYCRLRKNEGARLFPLG